MQSRRGGTILHNRTIFATCLSLLDLKHVTVAYLHAQIRLYDNLVDAGVLHHLLPRLRADLVAIWLLE